MGKVFSFKPRNKKIMSWTVIGIFSFATLLMGFQACQKNTNSGSIEAADKNMEALSAGGISVESHGNGDSYSGFKADAYHYLEPGFTCPASNGKQIPAIKERIELASDQATLIVNECVREVATSISLKDLIINSEKDSLLFQGKTYIRYHTQPDLLDTSKFWESYNCSRSDSSQNGGQDVSNAQVKTNFYNSKIISVRITHVEKNGKVEDVYAADYKAEPADAPFGSVLIQGKEVQMLINKSGQPIQKEITGDLNYFDSTKWMTVSDLDCTKPRESLLKNAVAKVAEAFSKMFSPRIKK